MRTVLLLTVGLALACASPAPPEAPAPQAAVPEPAAAPEPASQADPPYYFRRPITRADLEGKSLRELSLMRNTIFARAGQPFRKKWLDDYFRAQPWYAPAERADASELTELDRQNTATIADYEASLDKEELKSRRDGLTSRDRTPEEDVELGLLSAALGEWEGPGVSSDLRSPLADPEQLDRPLSDAQLANLSRRDLRLLRNTIFARHGRAFQSPVLQEYFAQKVWYQPDPAYTDARLTAVDRDNIARVVALENELGGMLTDEGHEQPQESEAEIFHGA